jgi:ubiquinone/menaquinone biosynthesis C-methylase UbiE
MDGYRPHTYGEAFADVYDDWYGDISDVDATVDCISKLAGSGLVCEMGVGSGRLAVPLTEAGVNVVGVDASPSMLAAMAAKPRGASVPCALGDLAALPFRPARCTIVFAAYTTLFNVASESGQRACIHHAASMLKPGGLLVIEAFVPAVDGPDGAGPLAVRAIEVDRVVLTATVNDAAAQTVSGQHIDLTDGSVRLRPWRLRYLSTDQLDELVAETGLDLQYRWSDWDGTPFGVDDPAHVSIYRRPTT